MRTSKIIFMVTMVIGVVVIGGIVLAQGAWRERLRDRFQERKGQEKLSTLSLGSAQLTPGLHNLSIEHNGLERTFLVYVPKSYRNFKAAPLIFVFHGGGGSGEDMHDRMTLKQFDNIAESQGQIIVYPDGLLTEGDVKSERHWNDNRWQEGTEFSHMNEVDDVGFVLEMINVLSEKLNIDKNKIYATGFSNGAMLSMRLACELSDKLAAVACVGGCAVPQRTYACIPSQPVSMLMIQSTDDPYVPWEGGELFSLRGPRGDVVGIEKVLEKWVSYDRCNLDPVSIQDPDIADDGTTVSHEVYGGCAAGTEVTIYRIKGAGHTWPGGWEPLLSKMKEVFGRTSRDINATEIIVDFFNNHPKR